MTHDAPQASRRILLAEDDEDLRRLLGTLLTRAGFRVAEAPNGRVALATITDAATSMRADDRIDLLVLDIGMPLHSGLDILRLVRRAYWSVPVIVITAHGPQVAAEAAGLRAEAVLQKPFDIDAFLTTVRGALDRRPSSRPPEGNAR